MTYAGIIIVFDDSHLVSVLLGVGTLFIPGNAAIVGASVQVATRPHDALRRRLLVLDDGRVDVELIAVHVQCSGCSHSALLLLEDVQSLASRRAVSPPEGAFGVVPALHINRRSGRTALDLLVILYNVGHRVGLRLNHQMVGASGGLAVQEGIGSNAGFFHGHDSAGLRHGLLRRLAIGPIHCVEILFVGELGVDRLQVEIAAFDLRAMDVAAVVVVGGGVHPLVACQRPALLDQIPGRLVEVRAVDLSDLVTRFLRYVGLKAV